VAARSAKSRRDDGDDCADGQEQYGQSANQERLGALTMRIRVSVHGARSAELNAKVAAVARRDKLPTALLTTPERSPGL
jgi:hypothetical protein